MITELEGAILAEIHHRASHTAFQVRQSFKRSPSEEWSGSAGAVYPAIRRLEAAGFIVAKPMAGGRGARHLSLSRAGITALDDWVANAERATGIGIDPFRLRASLWLCLPAGRWQRMRAKLIKALEERNAALEDFARRAHTTARAGANLAIEANRARIHWLMTAR
jgi:DNA-binding PadR family transcriptional regulator